MPGWTRLFKSKRDTLLDRFCRYVRVDTQSDESSDSYPSTPKQKDLLKILLMDLRAAGLADASMDRHGYVMATLASNIPEDHPAHGKVPTIGLIAHVDTYQAVSGKDVKPQIHRDYDGGDMVLPGDPSMVIRAADEPRLAECKGMTIITSDGTTLLGADDKAGVAEIVEVLWRLKEDSARLHGEVRVAFTPDEEVGRGTKHFDVERFGAKYAYTLDGSGLGEIEDETFCADSAHVTVAGADVHPGWAKGKMINAVRVASDLLTSLPQDRVPERTEGRQGFLHPVGIEGNVSETKINFIVRDFAEEGLAELESILKEAASYMEDKYRGVKVSVEVRTSYRNMKSVLDKDRKVIAYAVEAAMRAGLEPRLMAIRGGTDGSRLSYMGVLTPNIFDGSMNMHSRREWIPLEWMEKSVETVLNLLDVWVEKSAFGAWGPGLPNDRGQSVTQTLGGNDGTQDGKHGQGA